MLLRQALNLVYLLTVGLSMSLYLLHQRLYLSVVLAINLAFLGLIPCLHLGLFNQHPFLLLIQVFLFFQAHLIHESSVVFTELCVISHQLFIRGLCLPQGLLECHQGLTLQVQVLPGLF